MISACLIVKNEAEHLPNLFRWLPRLVGEDGEIILLDTGSTDDTPAIARRLAAEARCPVRLESSTRYTPLTPPEDFRFDTARNEALYLARGDWLFWCDADDMVDEVNLCRMHELIRSPQMAHHDAFRWAYVAQDGAEYLRVRLWRADLRLRFQGAGHEVIVPPGKTHDIRQIKLYHKPVDRPDRPRASGPVRAAILQREAAEQDHTVPRTLFYLGQELRACERWNDAIEAYGKYLAISAWDEERALAHMFIGICRLGLKDHEAAIESFRQSRQVDPRFADSLVHLFHAQLETGDHPGARESLAKLRLLPFPESLILWTNPAYYTPPAHAELDRAYRTAARRLDVIFRSSTAVECVRGAARLTGTPKREVTLRCLRSLVHSIILAGHDTRLWIVDDASPPEDREAMLNLVHNSRPLDAVPVEILPVKAHGNGPSLAATYQAATLHTRDLAYIVEDDYLHDPMAVGEMLDVYARAKPDIVVHPYDCPHRYEEAARNDADIYESRILLSAHRHWRTVRHTTATFMISRANLDRYWPAFVRMAQTTDEGASLNQIYRDTLCLSPMPTLAHHVQTESDLSPAADWRPLWDSFEEANHAAE